MRIKLGTAVYTDSNMGRHARMQLIKNTHKYILQIT